MTINLNGLKDCTSRLDLWAQLLRQIEPESMLEVGVWKGEFSAYALSHGKRINRYYMIDPWRSLPSWDKPLNVTKDQFEAAYCAARDSVRFAESKVTILRGTTREMIDRIEDDDLDLAYVDGDHTLRGISIDLISVYPKVKRGGFIGGDDFRLDVWQHGRKFEPTLVFPFAIFFAEAVGAIIYALPYSQFLIEKPHSLHATFKLIDLTGAYGNTELKAQFNRKNFAFFSVARFVRAIKRRLKLE